MRKETEGMSVSKIKVNTNNLSNTRSDLQAKLNIIRSSIGQIEEGMMSLHASWEGESHDAMLLAVTQDITNLRAVCDAVQQIIDYESTAVTEYDNCEQQVADLISQIRI